MFPSHHSPPLSATAQARCRPRPNHPWRRRELQQHRGRNRRRISFHALHRVGHAARAAAAPGIGGARGEPDPPVPAPADAAAAAAGRGGFRALQCRWGGAADSGGCCVDLIPARTSGCGPGLLPPGLQGASPTAGRAAPRAIGPGGGGGGRVDKDWGGGRRGGTRWACRRRGGSPVWVVAAGRAAAAAEEAEAEAEGPPGIRALPGRRPRQQNATLPRLLGARTDFIRSGAPGPRRAPPWQRSWGAARGAVP